jgi:hypothetical protein
MRLLSVATAALVLSLCFFFAAATLAAEGPRTSTQKSFNAKRVHVDQFTGTISLETAPQGSPVTIKATGKTELMKELELRQDGETAVIQLVTTETDLWWPWSILDWSRTNYDDVAITISAPLGTEYVMERIAGDVRGGDLNAPLVFEGVGGGSARFGAVTRAKVRVAGSIDVTVGDVQTELDCEVRGSGEIKTGSTAKARFVIAGSGDIVTGPVNGGLDLKVSGSGEADVASVSGPVNIDLAGSGDVVIRGGRADPFAVSIRGSGNVDFKGEAVNPTISIRGSGDVEVETMSGRLTQSIQGSGTFTVRSQSAAP